jgi:alpha-L-rhamnosidase
MSLSSKVKTEKCVQLPDKRLLPRSVSLPDFSMLQPVKYISQGQIQRNMEPHKFWKDDTLAMIGPKLGGFDEKELEKVHSNYLQTITNTNVRQLDKPYQSNKPQKLLSNSWCIIDFGQNLTGFIGAKIKTKQPLHLYITFDEILSDGNVDFTRLCCVNIINYELLPGKYEIETFEPYTLRYLKLLALDGECIIENLYLREFVCPGSGNAYFSCSDHRINDLFRAARETFRQNALDIFMDCPSRERAGWLCDSYFTARVENDLCGNNKIEKNFLENYLLPESFANIPEGMLPMCYPADHYDGVFIPNWALWFVIQLEEYFVRSGDQKLVTALKPKVLKLFEYFKKFQNEDGLLEKLDSWVFVEWSKANEFVQDVNYPTNMLYSAALNAAGRIYSETNLNSKAAKIRAVINDQSFDGTFFVDNAQRQNGKLVVTTNRTETCQYYAFYFNIASPLTHSKLWEKLKNEFGPKRKEKDLYPDIYSSNVLNGNFLRMELLSRYGCNRQLLSELKDYFLYMADRTGTLWENIDVRASCNHGFASHVAHVLFRDILGINIQNNKITVQLCDLPLEWCEGRIPIGKNNIFLKWWYEGKKIHYRARLPAGFTLQVNNQSGMESNPWS